VIVSPVIEGIRIYVIVVGVIVMALGTTQARYWRTFLYVNQLAWMALAMLNFAVVMGNIEVLINPNPGGPRTYVTAVAVTFEFWAVAYTPARSALRWWRARRLIRRTIHR
jgi:hypothetical protein